MAKHSVAYRARRKRQRDARKYRARVARLEEFGRRFREQWNQTVCRSAVVTP